MSEGNNYAPNEPIVAMVDCEVCDRSHVPSHPHIANIEGDVPIDNAPEPKAETKVFGVLPPDQQLPEWLRNKPGSQTIRPSSGTADQVDPTKLCQVCGKPWAPKHECTVAPVPTFNTKIEPRKARTGGSHDEPKCDVCGKKKRSNHNCKGRPVAESVKVADECKDCKRAGELCVRHGGVWSDYDTAKGRPEKGPTDDRIAQERPKPLPIVMPQTTEQAPVDRELAAIGTILKAIDGLEPKQLKRVMSYVAARIEETP